MCACTCMCACMHTHTLGSSLLSAFFLRLLFDRRINLHFLHMDADSSRVCTCTKGCVEHQECVDASGVCACIKSVWMHQRVCGCIKGCVHAYGRRFWFSDKETFKTTLGTHKFSFFQSSNRVLNSFFIELIFVDQEFSKSFLINLSQLKLSFHIRVFTI